MKKKITRQALRKPAPAAADQKPTLNRGTPPQVVCAAAPETSPTIISTPTVNTPRAHAPRSIPLNDDFHLPRDHCGLSCHPCRAPSPHHRRLPSTSATSAPPPASPRRYRRRRRCFATRAAFAASSPHPRPHLPSPSTCAPHSSPAISAVPCRQPPPSSLSPRQHPTRPPSPPPIRLDHTAPPVSVPQARYLHVDRQRAQSQAQYRPRQTLPVGARRRHRRRPRRPTTTTRASRCSRPTCSSPAFRPCCCCRTRTGCRGTHRRQPRTSR